MARGYDRRANLLAYIRQMRAENLARDSKDEDDVVENNIKPERKVTCFYYLNGLDMGHTYEGILFIDL